MFIARIYIFSFIRVRTNEVGVYISLDFCKTRAGRVKSSVPIGKNAEMDKRRFIWINSKFFSGPVT